MIIPIALGILVVFIIWIVSIYNSLVVLKNRYLNAFSQIDVQLKRRYDLIPNLVETAKGYMKHERETLEAVIAARNSAAAVRQGAANNPADVQKISELQKAEGAVGATLGRLFALAESYPDLKANQNMQVLMEELSSTENKVGFSRQGFNDSVTSYNNRRETFPANILSGIFGFQKAQLWEIDNVTHREAIKVAF
jgi:LemA protein